MTDFVALGHAGSRSLRRPRDASPTPASPQVELVSDELTAALSDHGPARYKWIACRTRPRRADGDDQLVDRADRAAGHLPRHHLNPLTPGNTSYLLWMIMGFLIVTAVLVVSLGRLGDMYGRVRMYNLGFAVFTFFSILLSVTWMKGSAGRAVADPDAVGQGVGGAMLFANSSAILTDAFPEDQRGLALGINMVAAIAGSFIGLVLGGVLAPVSWRLVFLVSVPFGLFGTVWAYLKLRDIGERTPGARSTGGAT
jgi:MFS family permease